MVFQLDVTNAIEVLKPLATFIFTMSVYTVFIFKFYRFLASKDMFRLNLYEKGQSVDHWMAKSLFAMMYYILEYIILMPIFIFFWFGVLSLLLTFLTKTQTIETILLVAMAVVGTVRVTAYYKEELARDLAKMLPFALLGVFLIDISFFNVDDSLAIIKTISSQVEVLVYYLVFIMALEFILRTFDLVFGKEEQ